MKVVTLAYDGLCTFEFGLCVEVFGLARPELSVPWYDHRVIACEPGPLRATGGIAVTADHDLDALNDAHLILVPGWRGMDTPVPESLIRALQTANSKGASIASVCSGVFVLAAAGLLDGRRATTHWRYIDALAARYPDVEVIPDVLYVDNGTVLTSAGSAAGLDMCLHLVRRDHGAEIANNVARRLVLPAHRDGGQAQFIPKPVGPERGGQIGPLLETLQRRLDEEWTLDSMARAAGMSPRTLIRRFRDSTGQSPQAWLTAQRVAFARDLLETTDLSIQPIAERTGLTTAETLRHHFRKIVGISPTAYRRSFGRSGGQADAGAQAAMG